MKLGKISVMMTAVLCVLCGCADVRQADGMGTAPLSETSAEVQTAAEHIPEDDYKYVIENGEAHIKKYLGDETEIIVPDSLEGCPVTLVSSTAFGYNVTSLTFPETITGFTAFKSLDKLREVNISEGGKYKSVDGTVYTADGSELVFLPPCACEGVFTVPDGVVKIADNACYGSKATEIILPRSLREIGVFAFAYSDISEVKLNEGLEAIGANAFANISGKGLSELYLPDSVISADTGFVNADVRVNAKAETEGLSCLEDLDDVYYRDDTEVQRIMRRGIKAVNSTAYDESRVIFTDIDGDDFPEMFYYPYGNSYTSAFYKYSDSSDKSETAKEYDLTEPERTPVGQIGEKKIYNDTFEVFLNNGEISYESFELLSKLPCLTVLHIYSSGTADLSGIELLSGLKKLDLSATDYKNTDRLAKLSELEWLGFPAVTDIGFLADMDSVRVLEIQGAAMMPDDYFSPAYDMDSLEYLIVSCWDENMTGGQQADFKAHRPDVELCFYKIG